MYGENYKKDIWWGTKPYSGIRGFGPLKAFIH